MTDMSKDLSLEIGGKERYLRFTLESFVFAQNRHKIRFPISTFEEPSVADVPTLVWIGLLHDHPRLPLSTVCKWINEAETIDLISILPDLVMGAVEALRIELPDDQAEDETGSDADDKALAEMIDDPLG